MTNHTPHSDDARFDRLVDGELSSTEYQALLAALDDEPGGWRRCALSFLEAQALQRELGSLRRERVEPAPAPLPNTIASIAARRVGYPLMALAMAASFLIAFGLGMAIRHDWSGGGSTPSQIAENEKPANQPNNSTALAQNETRGNQPLGNVTLVVDGKEPSQQQRVEVPLYNLDQVGQDYFTSHESALPPEVRELIERNGHQLRSQHRLVPLQLENGQQAVFPMEEVEVVPVRMPAF